MGSAADRVRMPAWMLGACACLVGACGRELQASPSVAPPGCRLPAAHTRLQAVEVAAGNDRFSLELDGVPAQVEILETTPQARVEVLAPLRFGATLSTERLPLRVAHASTLFGGRIRVGEGAAPTWTGARGARMSFSLERSLRITVDRPMDIACDRLGLGDWRHAQSAPEPVSSNGDRVAFGCAEFPLHLSPDGIDPIRVRYDGLSSVRERRPGWLRVEATWSDGSALAGWTPDPPSDAFEACEGGIEGGGVWDFPGRVASRVTLVPAVLRAGAEVAAAAGGHVWARASSDVEVELVAPATSSAWVRVGTIPGLGAPSSTAHDHIWVRAGDLSPER